MLQKKQYQEFINVMTTENPRHNINAILEAVKSGENIPAETLNSIRNQLASGVLEDDPYTLIHILGKVNDIESFDLILSYLDYGLSDPSDDGMVRRIALQVLGRMWKDMRIFDVAINLAHNDPSPYVREMAASILGTLGKISDRLKPRAAQALLRGFKLDNPEEPELWESFYEGMLELLGVPVQQWPPINSIMDRDEVRDDVLNRVSDLVALANED